MNHGNKTILAGAVLLAATLGGCANQQTANNNAELMSRVERAERAAAEAQAAARAAQQRADEAMAAAQANDQKVDRAFKKSQQK